MNRISALAALALTLPLAAYGCSKSDGGEAGGVKGTPSGPYAEASKLVMEAATAAFESSAKNTANKKWGGPGWRSRARRETETVRRCEGSIRRLRV